MTANTAPTTGDSLRATDLVVAYGRDHVVIDGVSLECRPGELVSVMGANGSGKSSLLKGLMGEVPPRSGDVLLDGRPITGLATHRIVRLGVGFVPQNDLGFPTLTGEACLRLAARAARASGPRVEERLSWLCGLMPEVEPLRALQVAAMSGGQRAVLSIAMALMHPELRFLVLDEPLAGLSPVYRQNALALLRRIAAETGIGVLLVEQNVLETLRVSTRAYFLQLGRVALVSDEPAALDPARLWALF